jgi:hypothetical protein
MVKEEARKKAAFNLIPPIVVDCSQQGVIKPTGKWGGKTSARPNSPFLILSMPGSLALPR